MDGNASGVSENPADLMIAGFSETPNVFRGPVRTTVIMHEKDAVGDLGVSSWRSVPERVAVEGFAVVAVGLIGVG